MHELLHTAHSTPRLRGQQQEPATERGFELHVRLGHLFCFLVLEGREDDEDEVGGGWMGVRCGGEGTRTRWAGCGKAKQASCINGKS